jgi:hypothetical protein
VLPVAALQANAQEASVGPADAPVSDEEAVPVCALWCQLIEAPVIQTEAPVAPARTSVIPVAVEDVGDRAGAHTVRLSYLPSCRARHVEVDDLLLLSGRESPHPGAPSEVCAYPQLSEKRRHVVAANAHLSRRCNTANAGIAQRVDRLMLRQPARA